MSFPRVSFRAPDFARTASDAINYLLKKQAEATDTTLTIDGGSAVSSGGSSMIINGGGA